MESEKQGTREQVGHPLELDFFLLVRTTFVGVPLNAKKVSNNIVFLTATKGEGEVGEALD